MECIDLLDKKTGADPYFLASIAFLAIRCLFPANRPLLILFGKIFRLTRPRKNEGMPEISRFFALSLTGRQGAAGSLSTLCLHHYAGAISCHAAACQRVPCSRMKSFCHLGRAILASGYSRGHCCMLKYTMVRFRGRQLRVAYTRSPGDLCRLSPGSEVGWWFADLSDQEARQLYVTAREEVAILRQVRQEV
jgi:hypothetical protein